MNKVEARNLSVRVRNNKDDTLGWVEIRDIVQNVLEVIKEEAKKGVSENGNPSAPIAEEINCCGLPKYDPYKKEGKA